MDTVNEGLQYGDETEWMSSQNDIYFTPTKEDTSDPLAFVVKEEEASLAIGFHLPLYFTLFKLCARVKFIQRHRADLIGTHICEVEI
jgi:hypothetical protein